jgi:ABC-type branched-subunit amino acid transport system permease subunit
MVSIYAVMAIGLNVQWGYAGIVNLAMITFVGIGGYTSAVTTLPPATASEHYILGLRLPFLIGCVIALFSVGCLAFVIGGAALSRIRITYLAIVTLCVGEIIYQIVSADTALFNGSYGIYGIPEPLTSIAPSSYKGYSYFYLGLCAVFLAVVYVIAERIRVSPLGRVLRAVREDRDAAEAFGRSVFRLQLTAFVIGSAMAALGGALLVGFIGAFNPGGWTFAETFLIYAAVFLGGSGNNRGVILGSLLVIGLLSEGIPLLPTSFVSSERQPPLASILVGLVMILVLRWRPQGLLPEPRAKDSPQRSRLTFVRRRRPPGGVAESTPLHHEAADPAERSTSTQAPAP